MCLGFQTKAALLDAATSGCLLGIPFATATNIRNFYPETTAMTKGHLHQHRQGLRSTKTPSTTMPDNEDPAKAKQYDMHVQVWDMRDTKYSDQTGWFPFTSYRGNKYVMVFVGLGFKCDIG